LAPGAALRGYSIDQGITVTHAEKATQLKQRQRTMEYRQQKEARRAELSGRLVAQALPESERASLVSERDTLNALLATLDADLQTQFWRYYLDDSSHSFYPPDSEEEVFQVPWWLSD
jgi:hypothetical protein